MLYGERWDKLSFVDELNKPDEAKFDLDKKEKIQDQYVNEVIQVIQDQCLRYKSEHFLEGEYFPYTGYSDDAGIDRKSRNEVSTKSIEKMYGVYKEPSDSEKLRRKKEYEKYEYYYNPQELKAKLSDEIRKLGFTQFEVDFIKRDHYLEQTYLNFWGIFKKRLIPTGKYSYILYVMLRW